jgi:hypothetical protein
VKQDGIARLNLLARRQELLEVGRRLQRGTGWQSYNLGATQQAALLLLETGGDVRGALAAVVDSMQSGDRASGREPALGVVLVCRELVKVLG